MDDSRALFLFSGFLARPYRPGCNPFRLSAIGDFLNPLFL